MKHLFLFLLAASLLSGCGFTKLTTISPESIADRMNVLRSINEDHTNTVVFHTDSEYYQMAIAQLKEQRKDDKETRWKEMNEPMGSGYYPTYSNRYYSVQGTLIVNQFKANTVGR